MFLLQILIKLNLVNSPSQARKRKEEKAEKKSVFLPEQQECILLSRNDTFTHSIAYCNQKFHM